MDTYHDYQEFLKDLTLWGSHVCKPQPEFYPKKSFFTLLEKSVRSAEQGIFSPFLYLALSAHLEWEDMMLLAAALYTELQGELFTLSVWKLFWEKEEPTFPGAELYYQSAPLLFFRETEETGQMIRLQIVPRVFLFLQGILLEPRHIPGLTWYHRPEEPLPPLGRNNRFYEKIDDCLSKIPGKKLIYLQGQKGSGRKLNYAYLAAKSHLGLAVISYTQLHTEEQLREIQVECLLNHAMFVLELPEDDEDLTLLFHWLQEEETIFLLGTKPDLSPAVFIRDNICHFPFLPKEY